jgi:ABC-type branched-subunit amino acid transport system permease subunit
MTAPAASADAPSARSFSSAGLVSVAQLAIVAVLLAGALLWMGPQQFVNALTLGAIYALIAIGYTLVYGIIELINFAHGDVFMVGTFLSLISSRRWASTPRSASPACWPSCSPATSSSR